MSAIEDLREIARRYGDAEGLEPVTVSWRVFGDSKKLSALDAGADIQIRRLERAFQWFSNNWPAAVAWPDGVARPSHSEGAA